MTSGTKGQYFGNKISSISLGLLHHFFILVLDEKKEAQVDQGHQEDVSGVTELKVSSRK